MASSKRGLRAGRGAVDFVRQQNVGEHRPFVKMKQLVLLVENGDTENVRRQQIRRELDALEGGVDGTRQRFGQRGFARAGKSSSNTWPPLASAASSMRVDSDWPCMILAIFAAIRR